MVFHSVLLLFLSPGIRQTMLLAQDPDQNPIKQKASIGPNEINSDPPNSFLTWTNLWKSEHWRVYQQEQSGFPAAWKKKQSDIELNKIKI